MGIESKSKPGDAWLSLIPRGQGLKISEAVAQAEII